MRITIRENSIVKPAQETPNCRVWSSNMDLLIARFHMRSIYFYRRPTKTASNFFDSEVLKEALSRVLVPFYPIAGRMGKDKDGRLEIDCNGEGVLFVVAETESKLDDFGDFRPTPEMKGLIPTVEYTEDDISDYPLLVVQVTHFKCGGISLGVSIQHNVVDGSSGTHFINSWSDYARGLGISVLPVIDRTLLRARDPPKPSFSHIEFQPPPSMLKSSTTTTTGAVTDVFKLTSAQLDLLKSKTANSNPRSYSTYVIIAAHIWRCASIARGLDPDQRTKMHCVTDGRTRLQPPLPDGYLGNVIFQATAIATVHDLTAADGLAKAAEMIKGVLKRMDNEYLRSAIDYTDVQPNLGKLTRGFRTFQCPNIGVNSWARLPIHDADFGWGRPVYMGPDRILYEGLAVVLPSPNGDGSLTVAITLLAEHMEQFGKLFYDYF